MVDDASSDLGWRSRIVAPREAVTNAHSGDHVFVGSACATPRTLVGTLEDFETPISGIQFVHFLTDGVVPDHGHGARTRFQHKTFYVGRDTQELVATDKVDYIPISISQVHQLIETGRIPIDVALIQVSPPDGEGICSFGVSVALAPVAARKANTVIAEVNPNMPRTMGDSTIHIDDIDHLVEVKTPIIEYVHEPADEVGQQIARYVARIIDNGATLQIGLGRIPNEMLKYLTNRRDLGIHSDVVTEPVVDLIQQGVITGARKTLHPNKVVSSYCMGTRRLYDLIDGNPTFSFHPIDYTCNPETIASNAKMVSVTQAFSMDLSGQICADQYQGEFYGGVSSQPDFIRGAAAADGGKAIICLASTSDDKEESRIRSVLQSGEGVTVARSDVHYVVTEYGIAYLFGKSVSERAIALIEIAHPDFRDNLLEEAKGLGYVRSDQTLKSRKAYPAEEERTVTLKDGSEVLLRPTRATDTESLQDLFYNLNPRDIYTRFFTNLKSLSTKNAQHLCNVSYEEEMAFVAVVGDWEHETVVGSSCYYVDQSTNLADVAYMIRPEWQGLGLGTVLQQRTAEYAKAHGLRGFSADVLVENKTMLHVFDKSGFQISKRIVAGDYEITMLFN